MRRNRENCIPVRPGHDPFAGEPRANFQVVENCYFHFPAVPAVQKTEHFAETASSKSRPHNFSADVARELGIDEKTVRRAQDTDNALKVLRQRSEYVAETAVKAKYGPKDIKTLSEASDEVLRRLERWQGRDFIRVWKEIKAGPKPGQELPKFDRLFKKWEDMFGDVVRSKTEANKSVRNTRIEKAIREHLSAIRTLIDEWQSQEKEAA